MTQCWFLSNCLGLRANVMNKTETKRVDKLIEDACIILKERDALRRQKREWEMQRATLVAEQLHDRDKIIALMENKVSLLEENLKLKAMLVAKMTPSKPYEWDSYDEADSKGISHPTDQNE